MEQKFFELQEGERVIKSIKPLPALKWYFLIRYALSSVIFLIIISYLIIEGIFSYEIFSISFEFLLVLVFLIFAIIIDILCAYLKYTHQYYWITNKRVIYKKGLIGYEISSIPLERISDVIISRTFLEKIFGFGSILIQTMAGQISKERLGTEASLLAVPHPEEIQELIFELIKRKRKEEGITM